MNTKYRIDTVENNERLHVDVRDVISLLQGISADVKLKLDLKTMIYVQSIFSSMVATYEASSEDSTIIIKSSALKTLKTKVFKNVEQNIKTKEKSLEKGKIDDSTAEPVEEIFEDSEADEESEEEENS